ncbi:NYN domain-containing protein [Paucibacter sp. DJ1R-11]|uniref:NYN domain-containing protein n=1 Tax=Paucibacter sp. DJ1R-11 TaxID=2893556 RepID=UPI0021E3DF3C|nr:NYN domain-containing protein [Paucibacter sp. DJ1R-11]MCV2362274.1 NYN domain-containing protein [Paucibacter sp. DJ1R-11]
MTMLQQHPHQQALLGADARVAVLVDCDNTTPDILEFALRVVAQFGRVVLRRGYGNHSTLANKWQEALVRLAFTPCLQYQYAAGKNTSDIALAMDAIEALFDQRADVFCLVTSDSDFAGLCRKLRERGATVHIVGEAKSPDALRNASDQFFEWAPPAPAPAPAVAASTASSTPAAVVPAATVAAPAAKPAAKKRPKALLSAVSLLAADTPDGRVGLGALGQYLKRTNPSFTPKIYGHTALSDMVRCYPELALSVENGSGHWVSLKPKAETAAPAATA